MVGGSRILQGSLAKPGKGNDEPQGATHMGDQACAGKPMWDVSGLAQHFFPGYCMVCSRTCTMQTTNVHVLRPLPGEGSDGRRLTTVFHLSGLLLCRQGMQIFLGSWHWRRIFLQDDICQARMLVACRLHRIPALQHTVSIGSK